MKRPELLVLASVAFVIAAGVSPVFPSSTNTGPAAPSTRAFHVDFPAPAYASGSCAVAALACANDTSPGCEIICGGDQQASCTEGSCSPAGNVASPNRCVCK